MGPNALRSMTGCYTCRRRRKKCDEREPTCTACQRLRLKCIWGTVPTHATPPALTFDLLPMSERQTSLQSQHRLDFSSHLLPDAIAAHFSIPGRGLAALHVDKLQLVRTLHQSMDAAMEHVVPFRAKGARISDFCAPWWQLVMSNSVHAVGGLAISTSIHPFGLTPSMWTKAQAKAEGLVISALRAHLRQATLSEEDAVILASTLVIIQAIRADRTSSLRQLASGLKTFTDQLGGFADFAARQSPQIVYNLQRADWMAALIENQKPMFLVDMLRPAIPQKDSWPRLSDKYVDCWSSSDHAIQRMEEDLFLLLHFRLSPEQKNYCSTSDEIVYLFASLAYLDLEQCVLQHKYTQTNTIEECFVLALILIRLEVITDNMMHPRLSLVILNRLYRACAAVPVESWSRPGAPMRLLWLACLSLTCARTTLHRRFFSCLVNDAIDYHFGAAGKARAATWRTDVISVLRTFLWHARLDSNLIKILSDLNATDLGADVRLGAKG